MLLITILIIVLLALINYYLGGRSSMYPPVVFCAVWAADLLLLWGCGSYFHAVSVPTLFIITCGCAVFSIGSLAVFLFPLRRPKQQYFSDRSSRNLSLLVFLIALGVPFFLRWVLAIDSNGSADTLLMAVRIATERGAEDLPAGYTLFMNMVSGAMIVAMISFCEKGKLRTVIALCLAVLLCLLTGAKVGVFLLLGSVLAIDSMVNRRIRWKVIAVVFLALIVVFGFVSMEVHTGGASPDASLVDNLASVSHLLAAYTVGGIVAFDRVVRDPSVVPHNWNISRFFLLTLNKLGAHFQVPSLNADYVDVGYRAYPENVYTIYFAYLDYGFAGMMIIVLGLGYIIARFYTLARSGSKISLLIYSSLFTGLALSAFSESFFLNLNFLVKLCCISWLFYRLPVQWRARAGKREASDRPPVPEPFAG